METSTKITNQTIKWMSKKRVKILILLLAIPFLANANCSEWQPGNVKLSSGELLEGKLKYCLDYDLIMLQSNDQLLALSPINVEYFNVFDETLSAHRNFFSIPYRHTNDYARPRFFELLYNGKISLLNRGYKALIVIEDVNYGELIENQEWSMVDKFFLLDENGNIIPYSGSRKELFEIMGVKSDVISDIIARQNLDTSHRDDLITILDYYQSIH